MPAPQRYGGTIAPSEGEVPAAPARPAQQPIADIPLAPTGTHILVAAESEKPEPTLTLWEIVRSQIGHLAAEAEAELKALIEKIEGKTPEPEVPQAEAPAKTAEVFPFTLAGAPEDQAPLGELVEKRLDDGRVVQFEADGNQICAHFDDFVNLQESPAGFGKTHAEALSNLIGPAPLPDQTAETTAPGDAS